MTISNQPLLPLLQIAGQPTWKNPQLIGLNKLQPRATLVPFPTAEAAQHSAREQSPWFQSLNGTWDFQIKSRPEEVTPDSILTHQSPHTTNLCDDTRIL